MIRSMGPQGSRCAQLPSMVKGNTQQITGGNSTCHHIPWVVPLPKPHHGPITRPDNPDLQISAQGLQPAAWSGVCIL